MYAYFGLDFVGIFTVDDLFNGSRNENVAGFEHQIFTGIGLGMRIANNGAVLILVVFQKLYIIIILNYCN